MDMVLPIICQTLVGSTDCLCFLKLKWATMESSGWSDCRDLQTTRSTPFVIVEVIYGITRMTLLAFVLENNL